MGANAISNLTKQEKIKRFGEVFTPIHIVQQMCDALERESPGAFEPSRTFLEPTCGDGVFVCEILRRKFARCKNRIDFTTALASIYAMELQADNVEKTIQNVVELCREYFTPTKTELKIINDHIIQADSLKIMRMLNDPRLKESE